MSAHHHRLSGSPAELSELEAIALLTKALSTRRRAAHVQLAIGDDAAVLRIGGEHVVWTVDACVEGVHFDRRWLSLEDLGWRALMAAASDLAAMGAQPVAALAQLGLPKSVTRAELSALSAGQSAAACRLGCPVIGGNISRAGELSIVTTVLGRAKRPLLRSGAKVGDQLLVTGDLGRAALGLSLLSSGRMHTGRTERACVAAWRRPLALISRGLSLVSAGHAAIDVSDGLAGDAAHLGRASGVRVVIEVPALLRQLGPGFIRAARRVASEPLDLALFGGEDYALLSTSTRRPRFAQRIGRVERGAGVWLEHADGSRTRVTRGGFDHLVDGG